MPWTLNDVDMGMNMEAKEKHLSDKVDYAVGDWHDDTALLRRVDWRILPVMFLTYFLQFVDKISLNVCLPLFPQHRFCCWGYALMMAVCQCDGPARGSRNERQ